MRNNEGKWDCMLDRQQKIGYTPELLAQTVGDKLDLARIGELRWDRIEDRLMGLVPPDETLPARVSPSRSTEKTEMSLLAALTAKSHLAFWLSTRAPWEPRPLPAPRPPVL